MHYLYDICAHTHLYKRRKRQKIWDKIWGINETIIWWNCFKQKIQITFLFENPKKCKKSAKRPKEERSVTSYYAFIGVYCTRWLSFKKTLKNVAKRPCKIQISKSSMCVWWNVVTYTAWKKLKNLNITMYTKKSVTKNEKKTKEKTKCYVVSSINKER